MYTPLTYITKGYNMVRTQIYLTEQEKSGIESVALLKGINQSEFIRQAIDELLTRSININKTAILDEIAGVWSGREDTPDIRDLRTGWQNRTIR